MRYLFLVLMLICTSLQSQVGRLDPHGSHSVDIRGIKIAQEKNCKVCHLDNGKLRGPADATCFNCHNKAPHSGVSEHMGKAWNNEKINCLTCHSPHRNGSKNADVASFFKDPVPQVTGDVTLKAKPEAMLKRSCTECHRW